MNTDPYNSSYTLGKLQLRNDKAGQHKNKMERNILALADQRGTPG